MTTTTIITTTTTTTKTTCTTTTTTTTTITTFFFILFLFILYFKRVIHLAWKPFYHMTFWTQNIKPPKKGYIHIHKHKNTNTNSAHCLSYWYCLKYGTINMFSCLCFIPGTGNVTERLCTCITILLLLLLLLKILNVMAICTSSTTRCIWWYFLSLPRLFKGKRREIPSFICILGAQLLLKV